MKEESAAGRKAGVQGTAAPTDLPTCDSAQGDQAAARTFETVVFCGDAAQVRAGFALALDALEVRDDLLLMDWTRRGGEK